MYQRRKNTCRVKYISNKCPVRFDASNSSSDFCLNNLNAKNDDETPFTEYMKCMNKLRRKASRCEKYFQDRCDDVEFRAVKTVRATMESVETLIEWNQNLRVIHLIRDPRPVTLSRKRFHSSVFGLYSADDTNKLDIVKESQLYCNTVVRDILKRHELEAKYPGIIREVIYEEFMMDPLKNARELYKFIDVPFSMSIEKWMLEHTHGAAKNMSEIHMLNKWQDGITYREAKKIIENCKDFFVEITNNFPQ